MSYGIGHFSTGTGPAQRSFRSELQDAAEGITARDVLEWTSYIAWRDEVQGGDA